MGINNDQLCAFIFNLKVINEYSSSFDNYIYIIYILLIMSISNISSILKGKKICSAFLSPSFFCKTYTFYDFMITIQEAVPDDTVVRCDSNRFYKDIQVITLHSIVVL